MTDTTAVIVETVEVGQIESTEVGLQGPRGIQGIQGIQGEPGFTTGIDLISGGAPNTDFTNEYQFDGGTP